MRTSFTKLFLGCLIAALSAVPVPASAQLTKYIDANTVVAGEIDLTKLDPAALEAFVLEQGKTMKVVGAPEGKEQEQEVRRELGRARKWLTDLKAAGATSVYLVATSQTIQRDPPTVIIPVTDAQAPAVIALFPRVQQPPPGQPGRGGGAQQAVAVPGVGVVFARPAAANAIKAIKPAARPDFQAALAATGAAAPIKLAFIPDAKLRQEFARNAPPQIVGKPSTVLTTDAQWIAAGATLPPQVTANAILQSANPQSAADTKAIIDGAMTMLAGAEPDFPKEMMPLLSPEVKGNQAVVSWNAQDIAQAAAAMVAPMARARQTAHRVKSASNIRQLLQTCLIHANENKGQYPADMKALEGAMQRNMGARGNLKQILTNPAHPEIQPAYVYIKPAQGFRAGADTVVIYESHKEFGEGINVGFADGHVEWIGQKQRFDEMLAKQAQQP